MLHLAEGKLHIHSHPFFVPTDLIKFLRAVSDARKPFKTNPIQYREIDNEFCYYNSFKYL